MAVPGLTMRASAWALKGMPHSMSPGPSTQEVKGGSIDSLLLVPNWSKITSWVILFLWLHLQVLGCRIDFHR